MNVSSFALYPLSLKLFLLLTDFRIPPAAAEPIPSDAVGSVFQTVCAQ